MAYFRPTDNIQGVKNVRVGGWLQGVQSIFGSFGQNTILSQTHHPFFEFFFGGVMGECWKGPTSPPLRGSVGRVLNTPPEGGCCVGVQFSKFLQGVFPILRVCYSGLGGVQINSCPCVCIRSERRLDVFICKQLRHFLHVACLPPLSIFPVSYFDGPYIWLEHGFNLDVTVDQCVSPSSFHKITVLVLIVDHFLPSKRILSNLIEFLNYGFIMRHQLTGLSQRSTYMHTAHC